MRLGLTIALVCLSGACGGSGEDAMRGARATCERARDYCHENGCPPEIARPVEESLALLDVTDATAEMTLATRAHTAVEACNHAIKWMATSR